MLRVLIWSAMLIVFALAFYLIAGHKAPPAQSRRGMGGPVTVMPATATKGDIGVYIESIGTVTPVYTASIYNQVTGSVVDVHFKEGQFVKKGDPLARHRLAPVRRHATTGARDARKGSEHVAKGSDGSGTLPSCLGA